MQVASVPDFLKFKTSKIILRKDQTWQRGLFHMETKHTLLGCRSTSVKLFCFWKQVLKNNSTYRELTCLHTYK